MSISSISFPLLMQDTSLGEEEQIHGNLIYTNTSHGKTSCCKL